MLEVAAVEPLEDRFVRMTLSDGTVVIRDLGGLLTGVGVFERITNNDDAFRQVFVDYGTLVWPGDVDLAPETLIWNGPYPDADRRPAPFLRPRPPGR